MAGGCGGCEAIAADDKFELPVHQKSPELMKLIEEACASSTVFTQNVAEEAHRLVLTADDLRDGHPRLDGADPLGHQG